ncbi:MAG: hypothetical protein NVSMB18_20700 [Acetobacteraceae bacterium]
MSRDPLTSLIRLRRAACDDAQRLLVSCLAAENQAQADATEADRIIARETQAATDLGGSDAVVEAFAAWLPSARRRLDDARRVLECLQAETARARAGLTACRTALESVEALQEQRSQITRMAQERHWQNELDDLRQPSSRLLAEPADLTCATSSGVGPRAEEPR